MAICWISGCGGGADKNAKPRVSIGGKVEFNGSPLAVGMITVSNDSTGRTAKCDISNGSFSCSASQGTNPGPNTVIINGLDGPGGKIVWTWTKTVDVPAAGFVGDLSIKEAEVKKANAKPRVVDD